MSIETIKTEWGVWEILHNNDGMWQAIPQSLQLPFLESDTIGGVSYKVHMFQPEPKDVEIVSALEPTAIRYAANIGTHPKKNEHTIKSDGLPIKSDGGSSAYYRFSITSSITRETMEVETGDVIRHMVGNDFDLGNIIKACRRIHQAKQGKGKDGTDVEYDANKIAYFAEQLKKES